MKFRPFPHTLLLVNRQERLAIIGATFFAAACAGDEVTRPGPIAPGPSAPITPAPSVQFGSLLVRVSTSGAELDADGYTLEITTTDGLHSHPISGTDSVRFEPIRVGGMAVNLTEVAPNCWVGAGRQHSDSIYPNRTTTIDFAVTCEPVVGVLSNAAAFTGVWEARSWEFFMDPDLRMPFEDVIAEGMAGTLTVTNDGGTQIQWKWRETYRWWGPNRPTLIWGHAEIGVDDYGFKRADALFAAADSAMTEFECDWGDCDGPLHGGYRFVLTTSRLVVTRVLPIRHYTAFGQPRDTWVRLVLERVQ